MEVVSCSLTVSYCFLTLHVCDVSELILTQTNNSTIFIHALKYSFELLVLKYFNNQTRVEPQQATCFYSFWFLFLFCLYSWTVYFLSDCLKRNFLRLTFNLFGQRLQQLQPHLQQKHGFFYGPEIKQFSECVRVGARFAFLRSCRCSVWTPVRSTLSPAVSDDHRLCWRSLRLKPFAGKELKWEWERDNWIFKLRRS